MADNIVLCSRCHKNPAMFFISKNEGGKTINEGLCLKCALETNIGPAKQMLSQMGISENDLDDIMQEYEREMESLKEEQSDDDINEQMHEEKDTDDFKAGGALPIGNFFNNFINGFKSKSDSEDNKKQNSNSNNILESNVKNKKNKKRKYLNLYCTNMTEKARQGKSDKVIGRDIEISRTIQILCRRTKNNPCLIGEAGVGKTAIAEALSQRIVDGNVPAKLIDKEIELLDLTSLVAGTQFRGQFESRIKGLVEEVKQDGKIILFIDEVHNLVGAGNSEGAMSAANILKPALSRGEIQVIGATTFDEYRNYIEKDAALERRFQPVEINEPSIDDAYTMLLGIKKYYEDYHRVSISESLVYKTVILSERYITERFLPDKAIDLLDESCTCANLRNKSIGELEKLEKKKEKFNVLLENLQEQLDKLSEKTSDEKIEQQKNELYEKRAETLIEIKALEEKEPKLRENAKDNSVLEADLAKVINLWTGIPTTKILDGDVKRLQNLEQILKENIIGQDEAVQKIAAAIRRSRMQLTIQKRPASFIFVGPTGVGKTELAKQLSYQLFDTPETIIRFDMSEFMEKYSVSRLIGSPPGYVGYEESGQLTEKVRRKPYSIILFDEIEKAHPDVMNILLQILDEGKTNDAHGRSVSFANTIIIMTSNAGSEKKESVLGFGKTISDAKKQNAMKALREFLRPEFIGRVDEIVVFNDLSKENYEQIAVLMLKELQDSLRDKDINLNYSTDIPSFLVSKMDGDVRGARDLRNVIRRFIDDEISDFLVENYGKEIFKINLVLNDEKIVIE